MEIIDLESITKLSKEQRRKLKSDKRAVLALHENWKPYIPVRLELAGPVPDDPEEKSKRLSFLASTLPPAPSWYLIGVCEECGWVQFTSTRRANKTRFQCRNVAYEDGGNELCGYPIKPLAIHGTPWEKVEAKYEKWIEKWVGRKVEEEEALERKAQEELERDWLGKASADHFKIVSRSGCPVKRTGRECSWCNTRQHR